MNEISEQIAAMEREIQRKRLNAPRVKQAEIVPVIAGEYYFTAAQGVHGAYENVGKFEKLEDDLASLKCLTFCVLILKNGFTVTGESDCASPANFDAEIGRKIARNKALEKVWTLEGYLLKERLAFPAIESDAEHLDIGA